MHNLLQFWNVTESIATFILVITVFGPLKLLVGDESSLGGHPREHQTPDSIKVEIKLTTQNFMYLYVRHP